jgi:type III pantothenate kinase
MRLLIDVGNSSTSFALESIQASMSKERVFAFRSFVPTHPHSSLGSRIRSLLPELAVDSVWVASVVRGASENISRAFKEAFFHRISTSDLHAIPNQTIKPEQVGMDRLVNVRGALDRVSPPFIVVDSGTAITVCVVDHAGAYRGGAILPGLMLSSEALHQHTSLLPSVEIGSPTHAIGRTTEEALLSGIVLGAVSAIEGLILRMKKELKLEDAPVIGTGGSIHWLAPYTTLFSILDSDLTLKGIAAVADDFNELENSTRSDSHG